MVVAKIFNEYELRVRDGYANLMEPDSVENLECLTHSHEVARVIQIQECTSELGYL
jgi:hypothetical protein